MIKQQLLRPLVKSKELYFENTVRVDIFLCSIYVQFKHNLESLNEYYQSSTTTAAAEPIIVVGTDNPETVQDTKRA